MKTLLLLFSLAAATALSAGHIQEAIVSNRTSKKAVVQPANASYECQKVSCSKNFERRTGFDLTGRSV